MTVDALQQRFGNALHGIAGWTHPAEIAFLYRTARAAVQRGDDTIVEIGSHSGRSTIALALGVKESGGVARVYAVDPHEERRDGQDTWSAIKRNLERQAVQDVVELVRLRAHDARSLFADASVAVLFVDGSHDYEDVLADIEDWSSAMQDGGVVAFNDPRLPGVNRALRDAVLIRNSPFRQPRRIVNTLVFDYTRARAWSRSDTTKMWRARIFLRLHKSQVSFFKRVAASDLPRLAKTVAVTLQRLIVIPMLRPLVPSVRPSDD